jgi:hypothetical protein
MSDYTTGLFRQEFVADVTEYIEDKPFLSVRECVKHVVVREVDPECVSPKAPKMGRNLEELGHLG